MVATPLPPYPERDDFEDGMIRLLVSEETFDHLQCLDGPRLVDMYLKYRASSTTLPDDQKAVIYASLCLARYTQLRRGLAEGMDHPFIGLREDLTYYRMTLAAVGSYGKASITSMCQFISRVSADVRGTILSRHVCSTSRWSGRVRGDDSSLGVAHPRAGATQA
jgi:hypothetical protein